MTRPFTRGRAAITPRTPDGRSSDRLAAAATLSPASKHGNCKDHAATLGDTVLRRATRSVVEGLEGRRLLSSVSLADGVLSVSGDWTRPNTLTVDYNHDGTKLVARANATSREFDVSAVRRIEVTGGERDDYIEVGQTVTTPASILGQRGDDTIFGGAGDDTIRGGGGQDWIHGRGGNDELFGDGGYDTLFGGTGDDTLNGGTGHDWLDGGAGENTIDGHTGRDHANHGTTILNALGGWNPSSHRTPVARLDARSTPGEPTPSGPAPVDAPGPDVSGKPAESDLGVGVIPSNTQGGTPTARITHQGLSVVAGQAVHVHALASTLNCGSPTDARYEWDFGDTGSDYNQLVGFNAAHVYDKPGTYSLTLRVFNADRKSDESRVTVHVRADERPIIYVSNAGSDGNPGTMDRPIRTWSRANEMIRGRDGLRILFRRGETFDAPQSLLIQTRDVEIGAYGSGSRPVIRWSGPKDRNTMLRVGGYAEGTTIRGLTFDSIWTKPDGDQAGMPLAIQLFGKNTVVRDNQFLNVGFAVNANGLPDGALIQQNVAPLKTGLRDYFLWAGGEDLTVLGNRVANVTREHTIRVSQATRLLFHDNDLTNLDRRGEGDARDIAKAALNVQFGSFAYVSGNKLGGGPTEVGPLGHTDGMNFKGNRFTHAVFEANEISDQPLKIKHGAEHVAIRNNVIHAHGGNGIEVDAYNSVYGRGVRNLTIANNTGLNDQTRGRFIWFGGNPDGASVLNNLYVAKNLQIGPYTAAPVYVQSRNLNGFDRVSGNVWPTPMIARFAEGGINWVGVNGMSSADGYQTPVEWESWRPVNDETYEDTSVRSNLAPRSGTDAATAANPVAGVFTDLYGEYRDPKHAWSAGAVQAS